MCWREELLVTGHDLRYSTLVNNVKEFSKHSTIFPLPLGVHEGFTYFSTLKFVFSFSFLLCLFSFQCFSCLAFKLYCYKYNLHHILTQDCYIIVGQVPWGSRLWDGHMQKFLMECCFLGGKEGSVTLPVQEEVSLWCHFNKGLNWPPTGVLKWDGLSEMPQIGVNKLGVCTSAWARNGMRAVIGNGTFSKAALFRWQLFLKGV
jgi:hypothetical protein